MGIPIEPRLSAAALCKRAMLCPEHYSHPLSSSPAPRAPSLRLPQHTRVQAADDDDDAQGDQAFVNVATLTRHVESPTAVDIAVTSALSAMRAYYAAYSRRRPDNPRTARLVLQRLPPSPADPADWPTTTAVTRGFEAALTRRFAAAHRAARRSLDASPHVSADDSPASAPADVPTDRRSYRESLRSFHAALNGGTDSHSRHLDLTLERLHRTQHRYRQASVPLAHPARGRPRPDDSGSSSASRVPTRTDSPGHQAPSQNPRRQGQRRRLSRQPSTGVVHADGVNTRPTGSSIDASLLTHIPTAVNSLLSDRTRMIHEINRTAVDDADIPTALNRLSDRSRVIQEMNRAGVQNAEHARAMYERNRAAIDDVSLSRAGSRDVAIRFVDNSEHDRAPSWRVGLFKIEYGMEGMDVLQILIDILADTTVEGCPVESLVVKDDLLSDRAVAEGIDLLKVMSLELDSSYERNGDYILHPSTQHRIRIVAGQ